MNATAYAAQSQYFWSVERKEPNEVCTEKAPALFFAHGFCVVRQESIRNEIIAMDSDIERLRRNYQYIIECELFVCLRTPVTKRSRLRQVVILLYGSYTKRKIIIRGKQRSYYKKLLKQGENYSRLRSVRVTVLLYVAFCEKNFKMVAQATLL